MSEHNLSANTLRSTPNNSSSSKA